MFHFVLFQTKHRFDIGIGPVSFNLTSLDKDTPLIRCGSKSASELGLIQKTKNKTKIRLTLMINCPTKANEN